MKILFAATPIGGHVNPMLGTAQLLINSGHQVGFYTGTTMRASVEHTGAEFFPFPNDVDFDLSNIDVSFPERLLHAPGLERMHYDFETFFIGPMASQHRGLLSILSHFQADVIVYEHLFYGAVPISFKPAHMRPVLIGCGITFLNTARIDGAPHGPALPFTTDEAVRRVYAQEVLPAAADALKPLQAAYDNVLRKLGIEDHYTNFNDVTTLAADDFWQTTVPSFEYPQAEAGAAIRFMGMMPKVKSATPLPLWAEELDDFRRIVLITQGTVANTDFSDLVGPSLAALADEPETLVIVTAGGRDIADVRFDLPPNARIATYLPFDWLMPKLDLMITNGGYGTVNQALAAGVPIIVAGATEDKPEVAARIAWSGVGINLETATPTETQVRAAVREIFRDERFINRSMEIAAEFLNFDSEALILESLTSTVEQRTDTAPAMRKRG